MNCLRSLGRLDRGFESHSRHGCLVCVCVVLCLGSDLATGWSPGQGVLSSVKMITELSKRSVQQLATGWKAEGSEFESRSSRLFLEPIQPPIQWVSSGPFPGDKAAGEADHSSPSSAEIKNTWIYTSTPSYVFMWSCLMSKGTTLLLKQPHSLRPVWSSYIYCLHTPLHVSVF
jgi:hypothetical protein